LLSFRRKDQTPDKSIITENIKLREANQQLTDEKHEMLTSMATLRGDNTYLKEKILKIEQKNMFRDYKPIELEKRLLNVQKDLYDMSYEVWRFVSMNIVNLVNNDSTFVSTLQIFVSNVLRKIEANDDGNLATVDMETRKKIIQKCRHIAFKFSNSSSVDKLREQLLIQIALISVFIEFLYRDPGTENLIDTYINIRRSFVAELQKIARESRTGQELHFTSSLSLCASLISCVELHTILLTSKIFGTNVQQNSIGLFDQDIVQVNKICDKLQIEVKTILDLLGVN
jgi:hypothetical protein